MINLFIAYVAAVFLPLLFHSWRLAVLALGVQGFLLAFLLAAGHEPWSWSVAFEFASLVLIRVLFVPMYLFRLMHGQDNTADFSLVAKKLGQWMLVFGLLGLAFVFGNRMSPDDPRESLQVGTAAGSILIGLLVLANQNHPLGQIIGLFTFEGGVTLLELLSPHAMPFPVRVGVSLVTVTLVLICGQYLSRIQAIPSDPEGVASEEVR